MRKLIKLFIGVLLFIFIFIIYMDYNDKHYMDKIKNKVIKNTDIKDIVYVNFYDNYYIIMDDNYLYLYDNKYKEILKEDRILLHVNEDNYDIIYINGSFMYFDNYMKDGLLIYRYYNIYDYTLIKEVLVGGKND